MTIRELERKLQAEARLSRPQAARVIHLLKKVNVLETLDGGRVKSSEPDGRGPARGPDFSLNLPKILGKLLKLGG